MWLILEELSVKKALEELSERLILEDILARLLLEGEGEPCGRMVGPCRGQTPLDGGKGGYQQLLQ